jgi:hypothetical protein
MKWEDKEYEYLLEILEAFLDNPQKDPSWKHMSRGWKAKFDKRRSAESIRGIFNRMKWGWRPKSLRQRTSRQRGSKLLNRQANTPSSKATRAAPNTTQISNSLLYSGDIESDISDHIEPGIRSSMSPELYLSQSPLMAPSSLSPPDSSDTGTFISLGDNESLVYEEEPDYSLDTSLPTTQEPAIELFQAMGIILRESSLSAPNPGLPINE